MKNLIFLLLTAAVAAGIPTHAQLTRLHNAQRGGDEIIKQRVDYKDPGRSGENHFEKNKAPNMRDNALNGFHAIIYQMWINKQTPEVMDKL